MPESINSSVYSVLNNLPIGLLLYLSICQSFITVLPAFLFFLHFFSHNICLPVIMLY